MEKLNENDESFISYSYLNAMDGKPYQLCEATNVSKYIRLLVEAEYNFMLLQGHSLKMAAKELHTTPDELTTKINPTGFAEARKWIDVNCPEIRTNFYDVDNIDSAIKSVSDIFVNASKQNKSVTI